MKYIDDEYRFWDKTEWDDKTAEVKAAYWNGWEASEAKIDYDRCPFLVVNNEYELREAWQVGHFEERLNHSGN